MPAELLRDVLRGPAASTRTRSFSMLPLSIVAHAAAALAVVIIPLAAEVELPTPAPLPGPAFVKAQPLPPPPAAVSTRSASSPASAAAPTSAPPVVAPEPETVVPSYSGPLIPGALGVANGPVGAIGTVVDAPPPPPPPLPQPTLVRPGGLVREPKKIVHVAPEYPAIARNNRVEGLVILEAVINEAGAVERIKVLRSHTLLDVAAIEAVSQWRYTPTLLNGTPVSVLMTITVNFKLN